MSVIPSKYNLKDHYRGSTFTALPIKFNFDITGATILTQIRRQPNAEVIHEWLTGTNITVNNASTGDVVLQKILDFSPDPAVYDYDVKITFPDGVTETYIKGNIKVIQNISEE
jgi:hypothetical protein